MNRRMMADEASGNRGGWFNPVNLRYAVETPIATDKFGYAVVFHMSYGQCVFKVESRITFIEFECIDVDVLSIDL